MLGCRFSFNAYAKNVREQATKCSLKTTGSIGCWWTCTYLNFLDLRKFDIYQVTVAPNCFKRQTNSWCPTFFKKQNLSYAWSKNHLVRGNIVFAGQSVRSLKKLYSGLKHSVASSNSSCSLLDFKKQLITLFYIDHIDQWLLWKKFVTPALGSLLQTSYTPSGLQVC